MEMKTKFAARIEPLPPGHTPELKATFARFEQNLGFVPNSILTMQRRPAIAQAFMDLNRAVLYEGTVAEELKMLVSLVTSQASGCRYCQAHTALAAQRYGASDARIAEVWNYERSDLFNAAEKAALAFAQAAASVAVLGPCSRTRLPGRRPRSSTSTLAIRFASSSRSR